MKYRKLGGSGVRVSAVSLGSWLTYGHDVDAATTKACIDAAFEVGINFFDTADVYHQGEGERALGQALESRKRSDYVLASKCFFPMGDGPNDRGLSRKHIRESLSASLDRLQTPYLDLYQCHRFDPEVSVREVVRTMDDAIRRGEVLYWGVSAWPAERIVEAVKIALAIGAEPPVTNQPPYSLLNREIESEVIPEAAKVGVGQIVYSPLAQGILTGKYRHGALPVNSRAQSDHSKALITKHLTPENLERAEALCKIADGCELPPATLALAWCLHQPAVASVITGATHPDQVRTNALAGELELKPELAEALDQI